MERKLLVYSNLDNHQIGIVIPCYNEEKRLPISDFEEFIKAYPDINILFVNDGSTDNTLNLLKELTALNPNCQYISLAQNKGKGEAVRQGILHFYQNPIVEYVGFFDADLSTPLIEAFQMVHFLKNNSWFSVVIGSRIKRLGAEIKRNSSRHYFGRIFVTVAYFFTAIPVYDSQCGAKMFRKEIIPLLFGKPFISKWLFDIEILKRMEIADLLAKVYEMPLSCWIEKGASKLEIIDLIKVPSELLKIKNEYASGIKNREK